MFPVPSIMLYMVMWVIRMVLFLYAGWEKCIGRQRTLVSETASWHAADNTQ